ncbi:MAG: ABC transporter permease subunit [Rubritalea sp.]|tara:strand:- start:1292 stop:2911 length:1620 start_codon:yes stop_codon:yes gene_type:complete
MEKIKYLLLKTIDITGLTFLAPVVRLCYREEPQVQLKKIGQWIIVPLIAVFIALFIIYDGFIVDTFKTKAGKLPTSSKIYSSYKSIDQLHDDELAKQRAYHLSGEERVEALNAVDEKISSAEESLKLATQAVKDEQKITDREKAKKVAPAEAEYAKLKEDIKAAAALRDEELRLLSESVTPGDGAAAQKLLERVRADNAQDSLDTEARNLAKEKTNSIRLEPSPELAERKTEETYHVERLAFLKIYKQLLSSKNKSLVIDEKKEKIAAYETELSVLTGADALKKAKSIVRQESVMGNKKESEYAGSKTIWYQVERSILCVFTGFLIGSIIAIPMGIFCGLNKTFMAIMTPFIAIFKPVSPIVWLPIILIVVMGAFPNPDKHPFMEFLAELPLIGVYKINPAFMASAVTVALCSLWATMANTALGVASIDKDHMNVARVLKLGFCARLFKIIIPSSLPLIFAGLRISLGVGWMVLIAAELLSSSEGIGKFVFDEFNNGSSDSLAKMVVVVFIVGIIGLILDRIMIIFQRLVSFEGSAATI